MNTEELSISTFARGQILAALLSAPIGTTHVALLQVLTRPLAEVPDTLRTAVVLDVLVQLAVVCRHAVDAPLDERALTRLRDANTLEFLDSQLAVASEGDAHA